MHVSQYVDYVGEFHLNLLTKYKALPIIIPRVPDMQVLLNSLPSFDGLFLCEGEDVGGKYLSDPPSSAEAAEMAKNHPSDASPDAPKDSIEFSLVERCLRQNVPILAICRGSQLLNIACGGQLYSDVCSQLETKTPVKHIDYSNYDDFRHAISICAHTPLSHWFDGAHSLFVNSYHHQGVSRLAECFSPMAFAPDGLIEAFYDARGYAPQRARFVVGLQFHPERMQDMQAALEGAPPRFEHAGCERPYRDFVMAAAAFKVNRRWARAREMRVVRGGCTCEGEGAGVVPGVCQMHRWRLGCAMGGKQKYAEARLCREDLRALVKAGATVHGATTVKTILAKLEGFGREGMAADVRPAQF